MIEIRHLTKKYGQNTAVNDLNLVLEPGNIYGFLGPNGAGKTTTMNIITGYIGATSGEVAINGHDINKEPEKAKQSIGYLPEMPPVYSDMKVLEYLKFAAELKQLNKNTRTADIKQVMDLTKLHDVENRLIRNLSKGYRQRVGLAQALLGMPEIIILDEPTVGLDPKQIIEIRDLIRSLKENHTVILSSHILQEISAVCDHVFIISKGELVASDTMENLEEQMSGAQELNLTVKGTEEQALGLSKLKGVKNCVILEVKEKAAPAEISKEMDGAEIPVTSEGEMGSEEIMKPEPSGASGEGAPDQTETPEKAMEAENPVGKTIESEALEQENISRLTVAIEEGEDFEGIGSKEMRLSLTAKSDSDIREDVFRYCAQNDLILLEMRTVVKSLEDVFLELTDSEEVQ